MVLSSKNFTRIQRFIYKELVVQHDFTCPDGMTFEDVGRQCFPVAAYAALIMHHVFKLPEPKVILGEVYLHDGKTQVHGNPHAMVYYGGVYIDFSDLTRNMQYPEEEIVWDTETLQTMVEHGADQIIAWVNIDSIYSVESCGVLYSGALQTIKNWRFRGSDKKKPRKLKLDRGDYTGSLGQHPDPRTIKRIGFDNAIIHEVPGE